MHTFNDWLENRDENLYNEVDWKKIGRNAALGGALTAGAIGMNGLRNSSPNISSPSSNISAPSQNINRSPTTSYPSQKTSSFSNKSYDFSDKSYENPITSGPKRWNIEEFIPEKGTITFEMPNKQTNFSQHRHGGKDFDFNFERDKDTIVVVGDVPLGTEQDNELMKMIKMKIKQNFDQMDGGSVDWRVAEIESKRNDNERDYRKQMTSIKWLVLPADYYKSKGPDYPRKRIVKPDEGV